MSSVSTVSEEKLKGAPAVRTSAPGHIIKINGEVTYRTGDVLTNPQDNPMAPLLGERLWTITPAEALKARTTGNLPISARIAKLIQDDLMLFNDFARTYMWAAEKIKELEQAAEAKARAEGREVVVPLMELILLNNREAAEAGIADPAIHPHRSENSSTGEAVSS
jgi:hypothetical protein